VHDNGWQESERRKCHGLRETGEGRNAEIAEATAHEGFQIPGQPQQRRHQQEHGWAALINSTEAR
jgi:hypothetical protein